MISLGFGVPLRFGGFSCYFGGFSCYLVFVFFVVSLVFGSLLLF